MSQISSETGNMAADNPNTLPRAYGEMGPISQLLFPQAQAVTSPFGTIYYNKKLIEQDHVPIPDIVRHEMTHVGQGPMAVLKSMISSSARGRYEQEAQNAEQKPRKRTRDIYLRPESGIDTAPLKRGR
jgi:hypothetical protein